MTVALVVAVVLAAAAPPASGPDTDLTSRLGAAARPVDASHGLVFGLRWRKPLVEMGFNRQVGVSFGRPAISPRLGLLFVGTGEGKVDALRLRDGVLVWSFEHVAPFETDVTVVAAPAAHAAAGGDEATQAASLAGHELVMATARDGILLALDARTGKLAWRSDLGGEVRAPAVLSGASLLITTTHNKLMALDVFTGKVLWSGGRPGSTKLTVLGHSAPLVDGDAVYAAFSDGYVMSFSLADGAQRWARPLSLRGGEFVDADADPIMANGRLFVASYSDGVYALNPADGQTLWFRAAPAVHSLAVHGANVIAGSGDGYVWGLRQAGGTLVFRTKLDHGQVTRMEAHDDLLVFAGGESGLVVLDARDGHPLQSTAFGARMSGDAVWVGNEVAVVSNNGYLYSFARGHAGQVQ